jgi:large exoprotein involved in heme utilization and adhesion
MNAKSFWNQIFFLAFTFFSFCLPTKAQISEERQAVQEGTILEKNTSTSIKNQVGISSDLRSPDSDRSNARGNGGNIALVTTNLEMFNVASVDTSLYGEGNAGNIDINAKNISLDGGKSFLGSQVKGSNFSRIKERANGNAGNININTNTLFSNDRGLIQTDLGEGAVGNAGNITINAKGNINLDRGSQIVSGTGILGSNVEGDAGEINLTADSISMKDFSIINASTNKNALRGDAKNINLKTNNLQLSQGAIISALTENSFNAGNINIDTQNLNLNSGGKIITGSD